MKKLLEGLKNFCELEIDSELKNDTRFKNYGQDHPGFTNLTGVKGLIKTFYNDYLYKFDMNKATIKKVDLPKNSKELKSYLQRGHYFLLTSPLSYYEIFLLSPEGIVVNHNELYSDSGDHYLLEYKSHVRRAFDDGIFDKMWEIDAPLNNKNKFSPPPSSLVRRKHSKYNYGVDLDKSGYKRRNLKAELAIKNRDKYVQEIIKLKNDAMNAYESVIEKVKASNDIKILNTLNYILEEINDTSEDSYKLKDPNTAKKYIQNLQIKVDRLNRFINNVIRK